MRIRFKPWARPELESSNFYNDNPESAKGKWVNLFDNKTAPLHIELGCGKGGFISKLAYTNKDINYVAVDLVDAMLGLAKRNIEKEFLYGSREVDNVLLTRYDIERISNIFDKSDNIERIYINFCNPWPKAKHKKKRLTHSKQLENYKNFLSPNAQIYFKTDDDELFKESLEYFMQSNLKIVKLTYDLENEPNFWENIETEHELMFKKDGIKIKAALIQL